MSRILVIVGKLFDNLLINSSSVMAKILVYLTTKAYLLIGLSFIIIGFSIGLIKRIIKEV